MAKLTVNDLKTHGKRVLMRVDYNVPMEECDGQMVINDSTRIKETLTTLQLLLQQGAKSDFNGASRSTKGQARTIHIAETGGSKTF